MRVWNCEDCPFYGTRKEGQAQLLTCDATIEDMQSKPFACYVDYDDADISQYWGD